jgi:hypothetical protein
MRIVQYITPGRDCPEKLAGDPRFRAKIIESTIRRLELRPIDTVEVVFL